MKNFNKIINFLIIIIPLVFGLFFNGCSSLKRIDDAVRIKPDSARKYTVNPYSSTLRIGNTLRGTVLKIVVKSIPDSCPVTPLTTYHNKANVIFIDTLNKNDEQVEEIPLDDIELIGQKSGLPVNKFNNINLFENFNDAKDIRKIREVPVDSVKSDTCNNCNCSPVNLAFNIKIKCIPRYYGWYFLELRAGYAVYSDLVSLLLKKGRDSYFGEIASGFRFGGAKEWGLGLAYSYGLQTYNVLTNETVTHSLVMLHGRWQSANEKFLGLCMRPFIYGQFGMTLDKFSLNLFKLSVNTSCKNQISGYLPYLDLSLPISWGIGAGLDIPVLPFMDLSFDLGYRSISFGESISIASLIAPTNRHIDAFIFRLGLTF